MTTQARLLRAVGDDVAHGADDDVGGVDVHIVPGVGENQPPAAGEAGEPARTGLCQLLRPVGFVAGHPGSDRPRPAVGDHDQRQVAEVEAADPSGGGDQPARQDAAAAGADGGRGGHRVLLSWGRGGRPGGGGDGQASATAGRRAARAVATPVAATRTTTMLSAIRTNAAVQASAPVIAWVIENRPMPWANQWSAP